MNTNITQHGEDRMRKRLGLNKKSVQRDFQRALLKGRPAGKFKGQIRRWLDYRSREHKTSAIIYGQNVYWVSGSGVLVTVHQIPAKLRKYL